MAYQPFQQPPPTQVSPQQPPFSQGYPPPQGYPSGYPATQAPASGALPGYGAAAPATSLLLVLVELGFLIQVNSSQADFVRDFQGSNQPTNIPVVFSVAWACWG